MHIRFWGSRGSIPVSGREYDKYGGDTACVEIRSRSGEIIIVDSGTGIRRLGLRLLKEKRNYCHMFFTHEHWDHIMGFPFFAPIYRPGFTISFKGCPFAGSTVREMIAKTMSPPNFPVVFEKVAAKFEYLRVCSGKLNVDGIAVEPIAISHPNGGAGYKFTENGRSFVFLTDNELGHLHKGGLEFGDYVRFCAGADLLVHDAEFTDAEYRKTRGWGHSTYRMALALALASGVKSLGLYHHNQNRTDAEIDKIAASCRALARRGGKLKVFAVSNSTAVNLR